MISDWTDRGDTTYIHYYGTHDELRKVVQEGDTVRLRRALPGGIEFVTVQGVVTDIEGRNILTVRSVGVTTSYILKRPDGKPPYMYELMDVLRPVENKMPDSAGLWRDRRGNVWLIDNAYSIEFEPKGLVIAAHIYRHDINVETVLLKDELSTVLLFVRICDQLHHA